MNLRGEARREDEICADLAAVRAGGTPTAAPPSTTAPERLNERATREVLRDGGEVLGPARPRRENRQPKLGRDIPASGYGLVRRQGEVMLASVCQRHETGGNLGAHE